MLRKRWAVVALAAVALGAAAPPTGPAFAAPSRDRAASDDAALSGHRVTSIVVDPAGRVADTAPAAEIKAIFGPDNRVPVSPTTSFPASATVLLTFNGGQCTGFMISARTVATAGHCVHTGGSNGTWRTNVVAYPGHDGTTAPFGGCPATRLFAPQGWTGSVYAPGTGDPAYDYGAVQLACAIGNQTGWFRLAYPTRPATGSCTTTHGYPVERPGQWASEDFIRAENAEFFYVLHDATSGQDGSPLFLRRGPDATSGQDASPLLPSSDPPDDLCPTLPELVIPCPCPPPPCLCPYSEVLGILISGPFGDGPGAYHNIVRRLTQPVINNLMQWS